MEITCYDKYGRVIENIVQWDVGQSISIKGYDLTSYAPQIHFANANSEKALVVESVLSGGLLSCQVPNSLARENLPIIMYIYDAVGETGKTNTIIKIPVTPRPMPDDVVYTDDVGVISLTEVLRQAREYMNNSLNYSTKAKESEEKAKTSADAAKVSETNAAKSESTASSSATQAAQSAKEAKAYVGSPLVANTVSAMTDQTKIYVYTGSESGYTAGNWYYHNGSAWVSGGVYNSSAVNVDKTLTQDGYAADAKVTGDAVTSLKGDIVKIVNDNYSLSLYNLSKVIKVTHSNNDNLLEVDGDYIKCVKASGKSENLYIYLDHPTLESGEYYLNPGRSGMFAGCEISLYDTNGNKFFTNYPSANYGNRIKFTLTETKTIGYIYAYVPPNISKTIEGKFYISNNAEKSGSEWYEPKYLPKIDDALSLSENNKERLDKCDSIIGRNKDVEHIVNASCYYGLSGAGVKNKYKKFSMLITTDVHRCLKQMDSAIEYLNYMDAIDCGVCLGDMAGSNYSETDGTWYTNVINKASKPFFTVLGNHDLGNSKDTSISATVNQAFEKFILPTKNKIGIDTLSVPYYYKEFSDYGVALIVLNNYDVPNDKDASGNYTVNRGTECFSQTQINWFINTLSNIPSNYHLIIARHSFDDNSISEDCSFTQQWKKVGGNYIAYTNSNIVTDIVNAWINGVSITKSYSPDTDFTSLLPTINASADFSSRGNGNFICYIVGHTHKDIIAHSEKYPNQKILCFTTTSNDLYNNVNNDLPRTENTKAEDAITTVSVNTGSRLINIVRIGSDFPVDMRERKYIQIQY